MEIKELFLQALWFHRLCSFQYVHSAGLQFKRAKSPNYLGLF